MSRPRDFSAEVQEPCGKEKQETSEASYLLIVDLIKINLQFLLF
jgi:hypothetical protein